MALTLPKVEIRVGTTWTDVSAYVQDRIIISRGLTGEGQAAGPQSASLVFNNTDGRFSPRNANGPYYGSFGRNTPLRISYTADTSYMDLDASAAHNASCADSVGVSITGDIDLRADLWASTWRPYNSFKAFIYKYSPSRSYMFGVNSDGCLQLKWSTDGSNEIVATSTMPVPQPSVGRRAVRATLDVDNGGGGWTVIFYTAATMSGSWLQLGDQVTGSPATSIYDSTSSLYVWATGIVARIFSAKVLQGIAGTERANPDFTAQADGATSFTDAAGNTWSISGGACVKRNYRFYGEVTEWPAQWGAAGRDVTVAVRASGVLQRISRNTAPGRSVYRRGCTSPVAPVTGLVAYWPMEDATGSQGFTSGLSGAPVGGWVGSGITLAADTTTFAASDALPTLTTAQVGLGVPGYTSTGQNQVRHLLSIPSAGTTNGAVVLRVMCNGTAARWDVVYGTGGALTLNVYDAVGTLIGTDGPWAFNLDGSRGRLGLSLTQNGTAVDYTLSYLSVGGSVGAYVSNSVASRSVSTIKGVYLGATRNLAATVGHVTVQSAVTSVWDLSDLLNAYYAEPAAVRVRRLIGEENVSVFVTGDETGTPMGYQAIEAPANIMRDCETADAGLLYEPRDRLGIAYRSARGLCLQDSALSVAYGDSVLSDMTPVEDDQLSVNDVTASRTGGSSMRCVVDSGSMSTQAPPNGIGTYASSVSATVASDGQLLDVASWRVHLGSIDEARYPKVTVFINRSNIVTNASLSLALEQLDIGDRINVTGLPSWLPPETVDQIVIGYTETITSATRSLDLVCVPASAYRVGVYGTTSLAARYSPTGTVTAATITTAATSATMTTPQLWTTDASNFPLDIVVFGERITVSSISGTSSPQTFNFSARAVNGIVKSHSAGEAVTLYQPITYAP